MFIRVLGNVALCFPVFFYKKKACKRKGSFKWCVRSNFPILYPHLPPPNSSLYWAKVAVFLWLYCSFWLRLLPLRTWDFFVTGKLAKRISIQK